MRLIGGEWRGRPLEVPEVAGLRPSADRLRETLFNWLQPHLHDARCLDLFAGSGALGLECLSRGAREATLVERDARAARALAASIATLAAGPRARLVHAAAEDFLGANAAPFDIVFVDPPFERVCQLETLAALVDGHLAPRALVHVEAPRAMAWPAALPGALSVHRERRFGDVVARLLREGT